MRAREPEPDSAEIGEIRFRSQICVIGELRCEASTQSFSKTNRVRGFVLAFPRTSSRVTKDGHAPFIASPATVSFYNLGQEYVRERVSDEGDHTDWFAIDAGVVREIVAEFDPAVRERVDSLLPYAWAPSNADLYLAQRLITNLVASGAGVDPLRVDEQVIAIARHAIGAAYSRHGKQGPQARATTPHESERRVERVLRRIARDYAFPLSLGELAEEAGGSVYHLCRTFRTMTGSSIHSHLVQHRLRAALGLLRVEHDLTRVALDTGFASHAHFSAAFRTAFGMSPRQFRSHA